MSYIVALYELSVTERQTRMSAQGIMEDVNKHVRTQLGHITALVWLDTPSILTFALVMILMSVLWVTHVQENVLIQ